MSCIAHCKYPPLVEQRLVLFPSNFGVLVLLSHGGGDLTAFRVATKCFARADPDAPATDTQHMAQRMRERQ